MGSRSSIAGVARRRFAFAALAAAVACAWLLAGAGPGRASVCGAEVEYVGPKDGAWLSASNWSPAGLPTAAQTACIPAGKGTIQIAGGTAQAATLQAKSSVQIAGGATLHISSAGGAISLFSADLTIDAAGKLTDEKGKVRTEGNTIVNGELEGTGAFGESELSLNSFTAQLSGDGHIAMPFASAAGEVAPGGNGAVGTLTFTKGFSINGNVKLSFDLAGPGSYDRIVSSDEVAMPSGAQVKANVLPSYSPSPSEGQEWEVIQSPVPAVFPGHFLLFEPWELRSGPGGNGANLKLLQALPVPPQPPLVKVIAGDKMASFEVTPTNNGNGTSPEYFVQVQPNEVELPAGFALTGLTNCAPYTATATVKTSAGTSAPSAPVSFTPSGPEGCGHGTGEEGAKEPRSGGGAEAGTGSGSGSSSPNGFAEGEHGSSASTGAGVLATPAAVERLTLGCSGRQLVLNDVFIRSGRVVVAGAAATSLAGRKVEILFDQGKQVASATVGRDGRFATTAPLPLSRIRDAVSTRYSATIGSLRSLSLKLTRRLLLEPPVVGAGKVTLSGRIAPPLTKPTAPIAVEQELECGHSTVVTSFVPQANGRFSVSLPVPGRTGAVIYRLTSRVAANAHARGRGFATSSLPLAAVLG